MDAKAMRYKHLVIAKIRKQYSLDDEISILRQRDIKPEEFKKYNEYCENAKNEIYKVIYKEDKQK